MTTAPPRRWFRFSLRTLFVLVTMACVWLAYHANWIRQRRDFLALQQTTQMSPYPKWLSKLEISGLKKPDLPWGLRLLGEEKVTHVVLVGDISKSDFDRARKLFPEATVIQLDPSSSSYYRGSRLKSTSAAPHAAP